MPIATGRPAPIELSEPAALYVRAAGPGTRNSLRWALRLAEGRWAHPAHEASLVDLVDLKAHLVDHYAPSTAKTAFSVVQRYLSWCVEAGLIEITLARAVRAPRGGALHLRSTVSSEGLTAALAELDVSSFHGARADLLLRLAATGLRVAEINRLRRRDVHLVPGILLVTGKSGRVEVPIADALDRGGLQRSLTVMLDRHVASAQEAAVIPARAGMPGPLCVRECRRWVDRCLDAVGAGSPGYGSVHALRRHYAFAIAQRTDITVAELLRRLRWSAPPTARPLLGQRRSSPTGCLTHDRAGPHDDSLWAPTT